MIRKILLIASLILAGITAIVVISLGVVYAANSGDFSVPATVADDGTLPAIQVGGYAFHGETFGNPGNPVIIALHGGPGNDYRYILPLKKLADAYFVVFYDQRGSGLSPRVEKSELTVDQYIKDLDNIVGLYSSGKQVILIGHSWGAMLASIYIGHYPEKVSRAVLAEPGFLNQHFMEIFNERSGMKDIKMTGPVIKALVSAFGKSLHIKGPDTQARKDFFFLKYFTAPLPQNPIAGYYRDNDIRNSAFEYWRMGGMAASAIPESGLDAKGEMMDMAAGINEWEGSALFISGSENSIIGPDYQEQQMKLFSRASLEVIEGAGHTMIGEKPEETLYAIRKFLADG